MKVSGRRNPWNGVCGCPGGTRRRPDTSEWWKSRQEESCGISFVVRGWVVEGRERSTDLCERKDLTQRRRCPSPRGDVEGMWLCPDRVTSTYPKMTET